MTKTTGIRYRQAWLARAALAALLLLALGWATPAGAQDVGPTKPVTTSLLLSLPTGSIFSVSPGPCVPQGEQVSLAGDVHVVTLVRQGMLTEIHLNMAGFQGIGQTTGNLYIGTGSQKFTNLAQPLTDVPAVQGNFTLEHTEGCASDTLPITAHLSFDTAGNLLSRSFISAGSPDNGVALNGLVPDASGLAGGLRTLAIDLPDAAID
jgi:hypothetical protein